MRPSALLLLLLLAGLPARGEERLAPPAGLFHDETLAWRGPVTARGAVVWSHGIGGRDMSGDPVPPVVRALGDAGWDVYRFDRAPRPFRGFGGYYDDDAGNLDRAAIGLRAQGYRRLVLAGHSYGAWLSLGALSRLDFLAGVLAIAPARHGQVAGDPARSARALADFEAQFAHVAAPGARLVLMVFPDDAYDPDPERRLAEARTLGAAAGLAVLAVDEDAELRDHDAGLTLKAGRRYGACIAAFLAGGEGRCP